MQIFVRVHLCACAITIYHFRTWHFYVTMFNLLKIVCVMKIQIYLILNWQYPIAVFDSPERVVPFLRRITGKWGKPFPDGAITVLSARVNDKWEIFDDERPFRDIMQDMTLTFLKAL